MPLCSTVTYTLRRLPLRSTWCVCGVAGAIGDMGGLAVSCSTIGDMGGLAVTADAASNPSNTLIFLAVAALTRPGLAGELT